MKSPRRVYSPFDTILQSCLQYFEYPNNYTWRVHDESTKILYYDVALYPENIIYAKLVAHNIAINTQVSLTKTQSLYYLNNRLNWLVVCSFGRRLLFHPFSALYRPFPALFRPAAADAVFLIRALLRPVAAHAVHLIPALLRPVLRQFPPYVVHAMRPVAADASTLSQQVGPSSNFPMQSFVGPFQWTTA